MFSNLIVLPIIIPLITAGIGIIIPKSSYARRVVFGFSAVLQLIVAIKIFNAVSYESILFLPMGGWAAPFGINLAADKLSSIMVVLSSFLSVITLLYGYAEQRIKDENHFRLPLVQFLMTGINLAFLTGDFFNLYVSFELFLMASYALMALEIKSKDLKFLYPYLAINLIGSAIFLCAGGLCYALFGNLSFASISSIAITMISGPKLILFSVIAVTVFGLKAGFFPMYYWLPNSYKTLPTPLAALFAGLLTKIGVYTILRLLGTVFPPTQYEAYVLIGLLAIPTMIFGILGAITKTSIKKILSFNLISHIGFMMMGIGIFSFTSVTATIAYMIHHVLVIASLFLIAGIITYLTGSDELKHTGNLWDKAPILGILFIIQALTLSGIPPFSGFWGKLLLIKAGINTQSTLLLICLAISSILTIWSMMNIWYHAFWSENKDVVIPHKDNRYYNMTGVAAISVVASLYLGFNANTLVTNSVQAADSLLHPQDYVEAITSFETLKKEKQPHHPTPHDENTQLEIQVEDSTYHVKKEQKH